jgi:hypothetical protein
MAAAATRGMAAVQLLVVVTMVAVSCMAAGQASSNSNTQAIPMVGKPMTGPPKNLPPGKFEVINPGFHKRKYEVSCSERGRPAGCYVACLAKCPNKCLVFCSYCMSFCSKYRYGSISSHPSFSSDDISLIL